MEVVYDLDVVLGGLCRELKINMVRAAVVGSRPRFVRMIRELILERVDPGGAASGVGLRRSLARPMPRGVLSVIWSRREAAVQAFTAWTGTGPFFGGKSCLSQKTSAENMDLSPFAASGDVLSAAKIGTVPASLLHLAAENRVRAPPNGMGFFAFQEDDGAIILRCSPATIKWRFWGIASPPPVA